MPVRSFVAWSLATTAVVNAQISIRSGDCVHVGKCSTNYECCSGICDQLKGCLSSAEAQVLVTAGMSPDALFIPRPNAFDGVRYGEGVTFDYDPATTTAEATCPAGSVCIIGNDVTRAKSSRMWYGQCNPATAECVAFHEVGLENVKRLSTSTARDADQTIGLQCNDVTDCAGLSGRCIDDATECQASQLFNNGGVVNYIPGSHSSRESREFCAPLADSIIPPSAQPCLCTSDCSDANYECMLPPLDRGMSAIAPEVSPITDVSVAGTCYAIPLRNLGACPVPPDVNYLCPPDHECQQLSTGAGTPFGCALPQGSTGCAGDNDCVGSLQCFGTAPNTVCAPADPDLTFDTCGSEGPHPPSNDDCLRRSPALYSGAYAANVEVVAAGSLAGAQKFTIPFNGCYQITAIGASGGDDTDFPSANVRAHGARVAARYDLMAGQELFVVAGHPGEDGEHCGGGGGASLALMPGTLGGSLGANERVLLVAGGGGGTGDDTAAFSGNGCSASTSTSGTDSQQNSCSASAVSLRMDGAAGLPDDERGGKGYNSLLVSLAGYSGNYSPEAAGGFGGGGDCTDDDFESHGGGGGGYTGGSTSPDAPGPTSSGDSFGGGGGGSIAGGSAVFDSDTITVSTPGVPTTAVPGTVQIEYIAAVCT